MTTLGKPTAGKRAKARIGPIVTRRQREMLLELESKPYGAMRYGSRDRQTVYALVYKGLVATFGVFNGVEITQRGRDFVRFRMRERGSR